jgi:hypothetical protein
MLNSKAEGIYPIMPSRFSTLLVKCIRRKVERIIPTNLLGCIVLKVLSGNFR